MPKKTNEPKRGWLQQLSAFLQIVFFITVSIGTIYNLYCINRQNKLIYRPVVGITDVKTTRYLKDSTTDTFENVDYVSVEFTIENVGSLPVKNFKIKPLLKIGDTILPYEDVDYKGTGLVQKAKVKNTAIVRKDIIGRMLKTKEKLIWSIQMTYSDWENYETYSSESSYEIRVTTTEPLNVTVLSLSTEIGAIK